MSDALVEEGSSNPVWSLDTEALDSADSVYLDFGQLDLTTYSEGLISAEPGHAPLLPSREERETYSDALHDLHRLLEEIPFQVGFAVMLLVDFRVRRDRNEITVEDRPQRPTMMSAELTAAIANYMRPPPPPSRLTSDLHCTMAGHRQLSRWLAAQLLDSATLRSLSCLDRVATMLHLRAGLAIRKQADGRPRLPSFNRPELRTLESYYESGSAWKPFEGVLDNPIYGLIKQVRDGTVHQRRWPSELHGEPWIAYWDAGAQLGPTRGPLRVDEGLTAADHVALLRGTWAEVVRPVVELGGRLLR